MPRPAVVLLAATAVSGLAGYLVTFFVAAAVTPAAYATFAVFWSTLFLVVGALGGIQQEITRAAGVRDAVDGMASLGRFAVAAALAAVIVLLATAPLWTLVAGGHPLTVVALVAGAGAYCLVAVTSGALYGARAWLPIATLILVDGVLRLAGVLVSLALPEPERALEIAVVLPFPLALAIVLPVVARRLRGIRADVPLARLARNTLLAVLAAGASAVLISGFPALVSAATPGEPAAALAPLLLALMITRAPIVIPAMAMQSLLIVRFRDAGVRLVLLAVALVGVATALLAVLAAVAGPALLLAGFGPDYAVDGALLAALVASSGLIAAVIVGGAGLLAASRHSVYVAGWVVAVVVTVAAFLLPLPAEPRIVVAALAGPGAALLVQLVALAARRVEVAA
ncbi:membrane protein [Pseudolysinimonas yzui]|uniref:Membrane protein n=2 Tax=Pseudolysinimonas yzui TaxID=2708254 RepID=A0A8J3GQB4_9MICO|nr:membrane protein [Pseudolysinimonas yzui]